MGKLTISMAMFNSFLYVYRRVAMFKPSHMCYHIFIWRMGAPDVHQVSHWNFFDLLLWYLCQSI